MHYEFKFLKRKTITDLFVTPLNCEIKSKHSNEGVLFPNLDYGYNMFTTMTPFVNISSTQKN